MAETHVSKTDFQWWMERLDKRFDKLDGVMDDLGERVVVIETKAKVKDSVAVKVSGAVSILVTGITMGLIYFFGGG